MGLFDNIISTTVFRYKADASQAIAEAKKLSGEQKKIALEQAKGLEEQGKAAEGLAQKYAKGGALIAAGFLVAKDGLNAFRNESKLAIGAAGIDIDKLSDAAGGLKTRIELLTIAQAGASGAWKLNTQQIAFVIEGMRALTKEGYDAAEVQDALTESLKKGKLEGLDKFGLSTKDLGSSTTNLTSLMKQLSGAVSDVGGDFSQATDSVDRSTVRMEDGLARLRSSVGLVTTAYLDLNAAAGEWAARAVGYSQDQSLSTGDAGRYARSFQTRRGGLGGGIKAGMFNSGYLFSSASDADRQASANLNEFRGRLRTGRDGGTRYALEAAAMGLPAGWREVDPDLAARFDKRLAELSQTLKVGEGRFGFKLATSDGRINDLTGKFDTSFRGTPDDPDGTKAKAAIAKKTFGDFVDAMRVRLGDNAVDAAHAAALKNPLTHGESTQTLSSTSPYVDAQYAPRGRTFQTITKADYSSFDAFNSAQEGLGKLLEATQNAADQYAAKKGYLDSIFGPVEDFDAYAEGFRTLTDAVKASGDAILDSVIKGEKLTKASAGRAVAAVLGAESHKLWGMGVSTVAQSIWPFNPVGIAAGLGEIAAAGTVGLVASKFGGSGATGSAPGRGASQDHRYNGSNAGAGDGGGSHTVVLVGDGWADDSPRYRAATVNRAITNGQRYAPPSGITHG